MKIENDDDSTDANPDDRPGDLTAASQSKNPVRETQAQKEGRLARIEKDKAEAEEILRAIPKDLNGVPRDLVALIYGAAGGQDFETRRPSAIRSKIE